MSLSAFVLNISWIDKIKFEIKFEIGEKPFTLKL